MEILKNGMHVLSTSKSKLIFRKPYMGHFHQDPKLTFDHLYWQVNFQAFHLSSSQIHPWISDFTQWETSESFQIPVANHHQVLLQKSLHLWGQLRLRGRYLLILPEEARMARLAAPATTLHPGGIRQENLGAAVGGCFGTKV